MARSQDPSPSAPGQQPPGYGHPQQPVRVQQVGHSVTRPAWTLTQIAMVVFSGGILWPVVWLRRRRKTTVTRHY